jgi:hypothetical protein
LSKLSSPRSTIHLGPALRFKNWLDASIQWEYRSDSTWDVYPAGDSRNKIPDVNLFNLKLTAHQGDIGFGLLAENIFNKKYEGFPEGLGRQLERRLLADLSYKF